MKKALTITFISKYSNISIQFLIMLVLSRLLSPAEFGVVAVISIFVSFFGLLGDMGIGPAIIQFKKLTVEDINSIFKFVLGMGLVLAIAFFFFSYAISWFFQETIYRLVCQSMSIALFFMIGSIVPTNFLYRHKKFKEVGFSSVISNIFSGGLAIYAAYAGWGVYALVLNTIVQSCFNFIFCLIMSRLSFIGYGFSWKPIRNISSFSFYQFMFNFVNYITRNIDNLLVGKLLGARDLGFYDRAYRTTMYSLQGLTFVINPVLQPFLSDQACFKEKIYNQYVVIIKYLSLIGALIVPICFFNAKEIIFILFGNKWLLSVAPFQWLSLSIGIQLVLSTIGSVFQATENTKYMFRTGLISSITFIVLSLTGLIVSGSINVLSAFISFGFLINFIQNFYVLIKKVFQKSFIRFLLQFKLPIVITIFLFFENWLIPVRLSNIYFSLLVKSSFITSSYFILCLFFKQRSAIKKLLHITN